MTKPQQAMRDLARMFAQNDMTGNLSPLPGIFPDTLAPQKPKPPTRSPVKDSYDIALDWVFRARSG
jgi:hypothetical protein